jgi:hypothetical protein
MKKEKEEKREGGLDRELGLEFLSVGVDLDDLREDLGRELQNDLD